MLRSFIKNLPISTRVRNFGVGSRANFKVAIAGAKGGVGQPLAMLIKMNTLVTHLSLHDIENVLGVALDVSHIERSAKTSGHNGNETLGEALRCADIVIITAGAPRKPGMVRKDLLKVNADITINVMKEIAKNCPKALIAIVTNPVNSCVPIASKVLQEAGVYDPKRLFGVFTLDHVRVRKFVGDLIDRDPLKIKIPVIGGHSAETIVPVFSQCEPKLDIDLEERMKLINRLKNAGTEVVKAKKDGSSTLSMAYAGARFVNALLQGLAGAKNVIEGAYVESNVTEAQFFSNPLMLGKEGVKENLGLPKLDACEQELLEECLKALTQDIKDGLDYKQK